MEWLADFGIFLCGMFAMGIVWFANDNGKNSPYGRGFHDGYKIGKKEIDKDTNVPNKTDG